MPIDLALEDAEDKLQATTDTAAAAENNNNDAANCDGDVPAKRRRADATVPECYTTTETDTVNKVPSCSIQRPRKL